MGMPVDLNTMLITHGEEERVEQNLFELKKTGYCLYPLDIPVEVRKTQESEASGSAVIQKIAWEKGMTFIRYELVSLNTPN
nr:DUF2584 domain-containing protein [Heyndrickxia acidiproducens]